MTNLKALWDVSSVAWRDNHVNFYNRYLLLLDEEYTDKQASRVYSNW